MAFWERRLFADGRSWVCRQATGDVLEVAIGTGRNLGYYPAAVRLTGIEFSPAMLELARRRADQLGRKVDLRPGGQLLLLDHVAGGPRWVRAIQWLLELATRPLGGEYLRRRPLLQVQAEGFTVTIRRSSRP
jgi:hypothetical protein